MAVGYVLLHQQNERYPFVVSATIEKDKTMTMSWGMNEEALNEVNQEPSQTIFLATRMDLMARLVPKREKPKSFSLATRNLSPSVEFQPGTTLH